MRTITPRIGEKRPPVGIAVASLVGATLFWAGNYVIGALALEVMSPPSLVLLRWAMALVPLFAAAQLIERPNWRAVARSWPWLLGLSASGLIGYNLLLYYALRHTDAFNASLINAFNPVLITIAAAIFLGERLTPRRILGVLIALAGILLILGGTDPFAFLRVGLGDGQLLMTGAILAWTIYTVLGRRSPYTPPIAGTAVQALVAVIVLTPIVTFNGGLTLPTSNVSLLALVFIGLFPSVGSYLLWNRALVVIPASRAGVFLNLITVFAVMITILIGHPVNITQILGGATVITGVIVTNISRPLGPVRS